MERRTPPILSRAAIFGTLFLAACDTAEDTRLDDLRSAAGDPATGDPATGDPTGTAVTDEPDPADVLDLYARAAKRAFER